MFDEVARRFGDGGMPALHPLVAEALVNKAWNLDQLDRHGEEIAAYDDLVRRFADASGPKIRR